MCECGRSKPLVLCYMVIKFYALDQNCSISCSFLVFEGNNFQPGTSFHLTRFLSVHVQFGQRQKKMVTLIGWIKDDYSMIGSAFLIYNLTSLCLCVWLQQYFSLLSCPDFFVAICQTSQKFVVEGPSPQSKILVFYGKSCCYLASHMKMSDSSCYMLIFRHLNFKIWITINR